jgi:hypothetical protein
MMDDRIRRARPPISDLSLSGSLVSSSSTPPFCLFESGVPSAHPCQAFTTAPPSLLFALLNDHRFC